MGELGRWLRESQHAYLTGTGLALGLGLLVAAALVLRRENRRLLRGPALLLALHGLALAVRWAVANEPAIFRLSGLVALFFLLASIGRSGFLIVVHSALARRLGFPLPRIVQDIIQIGIYVSVALVTLSAAGVEPGSLLATSALLTAVIGLSLQDTLGNMFAGLAIQAERPFEVGDWLQYGDKPEHTGRVTEINWRATRILTLDEIEITVPNGTLAKAALSNFSKPTSLCRRNLYVAAPHDAPPEGVIQLLVGAARGVPGVLVDPPASAVTFDFDERGVRYWLRYYIHEFARRDVIDGEVRKRVWYALDRAGMRVPPPRRQVELRQVSAETRTAELAARVEEIDRALARVDFLEPLSPEDRRRVAELAELRRYAPGEVVIQQGTQGDELFIVRRGKLRVELEQDGASREVGRLGPGELFGEMSVMTGEPRRASVITVHEVETIAVPKQAFQRLLAKDERLLGEIGEILARRNAELEERAEERPGDSRRSLHDDQALLVQRIRRFFAL